MQFYKLHHFLIFLFQSMNEHVTGFKDHILFGKTIFPPNLQNIAYSEGVRLILRAADHHYFIQEKAFSHGMYLQMIKEEASHVKAGPFLSQLIVEEMADPLFDDLL